MSNQPGAQDTKFFNRPKFDYKKFNDPCLPNGEKPDFGNRRGPKRGQNKNNQQYPQYQQQQQQPYQQYQQYHQYQQNQQNQQNQPNQHQSTNSKPQQSRKQNRHQKGNSPLSSPQLLQKSPVIQKSINYKLDSSSRSPNSAKDNKKATTFAGPTFHNSPETKSLPKPSFL